MAKTTKASTTSAYVQITDEQGNVDRVPAVVVVDPNTGLPITASSGAPTVFATSVRKVQTPATGSNWAAFGTYACTGLDIVNSSAEASNLAVPIRWRLVGTTDWMPIDAGASYLITGITNASNVEIQRNDQSNTQIWVRALALA